MCFGSFCFFRYHAFLAMSMLCLVQGSLMKILVPLSVLPCFRRAFLYFLLTSIILMLRVLLDFLLGRGRLASMLLQSKPINLILQEGSYLLVHGVDLQVFFFHPIVRIHFSIWSGFNMESGDNHVIHAYILFQNLVKSWGKKIHRSQIGMEHFSAFLWKRQLSSQGSPCFRQQPLLSISLNTQMIFLFVFTMNKLKLKSV